MDKTIVIIFLICAGILGLLLFFRPDYFYNLNIKFNFAAKALWPKYYQKYYKEESKMAIQDFKIAGGVMLVIIILTLFFGNLNGGIFRR